jgi:hypothetical protein
MEDFTNSFATKEVINAEEDFDPFNIGVASATNANTSKSLKTATNNKNIFSTDFAAVDNRSASSALPPRIMVTFKTQEEVSSNAYLSDENEGSSDVQIEGTVLVSCKSCELGMIPTLICRNRTEETSTEN